MGQVGLSDVFSPVLSYSQDMFKGIVAVALVGTIVCLWTNHINRKRHQRNPSTPAPATEEFEPGGVPNTTAQRDQLGRDIRTSQRITHVLRNTILAISRGRYLDVIFIIGDFVVTQFRLIPDRIRIAYSIFSTARRLTRIGV